MRREDLLAYRGQLQRKLEAVNVLLEEEVEQVQHTQMVIQRNGTGLRDDPATAESWQAERLSESRTTLLSAMQEFISRTEKPFTKNDLVRSIRERYPKLDFSDKSVSNPLIKFCSEGLVEVVRPGAGKVPNIYRSKPPNEKPAA